MWIASVHGFVSIVEKPRGSWQVRARVKRDLINLRKAAKLDCKIVEDAGTDYAFRIYIQSKEDLGKVFSALMESVNYANFKDEIKHRPDQVAKHIIYAQWWGDMLALQRAGREARDLSPW